MNLTKMIYAALVFFTSLQATTYDWGSPQARSRETGFSAYSSCSISASGNGVCAWVEGVDDDVEIRASYYDGSSWSSPTTISTGNQDAFYLQAKINDSNQAVIVWCEQRQSGDSYYLKTSFLDSGQWSSPTTIYSGLVLAVNLSYNNSNEALVAWQNDSSVGMVRSFYDDEWATITIVGTGSFSTSAGDLNNSSIGFGVWTEDLGGTSVVKATVAALRGSLTAQEISDQSPLVEGSAAISGNNSSEAIAVWIQDDSIYSSRYTNNTWTNPEIISTGTVDSSYPPQISYTDSGVGFASWTEGSGTETTVYAARFDGSSWNAPSLVSAPGSISYSTMQDATTATNAG